MLKPRVSAADPVPYLIVSGAISLPTSPGQKYRQILERGEADPDAAQARAVEEFDRIFQQLKDQPASRGVLNKLRERLADRLGLHSAESIPGLYLWGGVGRGKTWLMDLFFESLPSDRKKRVHFHRYMRSVHESLSQLSEVKNPLAVIAKQQASQFRILCFDEFVVEDIGDAMILSGLLESLFSNGVTLIATSNSAPQDLYRDGLQRDRFKPAIALIEQHTIVLKMEDGVDYRLRTLRQEQTFLVPLNDENDALLKKKFKALATDKPSASGSIDVLGREIHYRFRCSGIVWFEFDAICGGLRSSADYLDISREHHTVFVSNIPALDHNADDAARRFIEMIDIFYDTGINLILSAAREPHSLYTGSRLTRPFERTVSRLIEMQSSDYLAQQKSQLKADIESA